MPACTKDRESVLFGAFLLKERNSSCDAFCPARFHKLPAEKGNSLLCAQAQEGTGRVRAGPVVGRGAQLNPGPAAPLPGSRQGKGCAEVLRLPDVWSVLWEALLLQKGLQVEFPVTATLRPMGGPDSGWE